ncbi:exonuclease SbcCD subunit D [Actinocorallia longicatena]|uniref:Nuclease SbcCD subunit D n=1 Tax=Actinocorallia longicatena TaxID=111803 RepID=A0ABP6QG52_9ACTN
MRMLHTSDWHLGRSFHREDLLGAQAAFADHLVETVDSAGVDCVLVSGDVYDRALPAVDAVRLYDDTVRRLASRTRVVLVSGNHDSAIRLGVNAELLDVAGVHIRTSPATVGTPVLVDDVAIFPIPYLEPDVVRTAWSLPERSHAAALTEAMRRISGSGHPGPRVVLAHAFVTSGDVPAEESESERDISVGGVSLVPASVFDGIGYTALGHLHGRRVLTERVRYSGSPLAYSFSEEHQLKGSWLVDLDSGSPGAGSLAAEFVEAPVPRPVARLRGTLDTLLTDAAFEKHREHWLQVTLTDFQRPAGAMERLRARFPHTLVLGFEPEGAARPEREVASRIRERSGLALATDFVHDMTGAEPSAAELGLLEDAFTDCRQEEPVRVPAPRTEAVK